LARDFVSGFEVGTGCCFFDVAAFDEFLKSHIKVNGKIGNLGNVVAVANDGKKITVTAEGAFAKRYLKYLTKKFLKKKNVRDFLHVVASNASTYELRFFHIDQDEDATA